MHREREWWVPPPHHAKNHCVLGTPVPGKFCSFLVGGHDLMLWYRHLAKEMLELAQHYYDDITFTRFILQLTGACTIEEAVQVNRV